MVKIPGLMDLHSRTDYDKGMLSISDINNDPWAALESWVKEAVNSGIQDPTAFHLTTLDGNGFPHGRIVLLRDTRQWKLVFYTNTLVRKEKICKPIPRRVRRFSGLIQTVKFAFAVL